MGQQQILCWQQFLCLQKYLCFVCFAALRPKSTTMVMARRSANLKTPFLASLKKRFTSTSSSERSGSVVECLTRDRVAAASSLTGDIALCPSARRINPSLVPVQPRKTRPYITENFLMGRNESNQTSTSCAYFRLKLTATSLE